MLTFKLPQDTRRIVYCDCTFLLLKYISVSKGSQNTILSKRTVYPLLERTVKK